MTDVDVDPGCTLNKKIRNAQLAQYNFILGEWLRLLLTVRPSVLPWLHLTRPFLWPLSGGREGEDQRHGQRAHTWQQSARRAHGERMCPAAERAAELPQPERRGGILSPAFDDGTASLLPLPSDREKNKETNIKFNMSLFSIASCLLSIFFCLSCHR